MPGAALLLCLVVGVTDGDTLTARCGDDPQVKVRLAEIDAPEKSQAFGKRAKEALSDLTYMKQVVLAVESTDRYGRWVAQIEVDGRDVNLAMVEQGMAWCFDRYLRNPEVCHARQDAAREHQRGLWSDAAPVAPWEFRKLRRQARPK